MALEKALWGRIQTGNKNLEACGYKLHACRIENDAGTGNPDVEECIDGVQIWLELKSEMRPKRPATPIRPKCRESQSIWHRKRSEAGCKHNFVLIQVGEAYSARFYLIPGSRYDEITAPESYLEAMSLVKSDATMSEVLLTAMGGYSYEN